MQHTTAYNQVMIDLALQGCGDASRIFEVAQLSGKGITDDITAGEVITTPAEVLSKRKLVSYFLQNANRPASDEAMQVSGIAGGLSSLVVLVDGSLRLAYNQVMIDMALQTCGDASRIFDVAMLNGKGITDDITPGTVVLSPVVSEDKRRFVNLFSINANRPASGENTLNEPEGIGYWIIEDTFIVQ